MEHTKVKVCLPDGNIDFFDIVAGVLQRDTSAPYLCIVGLDYALRTSIVLMKENGFTLETARSRRYPERTITDADYADDITLLANTPALAESLLHSLKRAADVIGLLVNADKAEYMHFNQRGDISTLNDCSRELEDKFTDLSNIVLSTQNDFNTRLAKAWTAIDRLPIIWKSDLFSKIKRFFQASVVSILQYGCTT